MKVRVFRPFPGEEMAKALRKCQAIAIFDRCEGYNANGGPLAADLEAALFRAKASAEVINYVYGLSGRDLTVNHVTAVFEELAEAAEHGVKDKKYRYIGLREKED